MRKAQEISNRGSQNLFKKAVEKSSEVIFLTDREGIITYINPEFTRLYGYSSEEVIGNTTPRILKSGELSHQDYQSLWETLLDRRVARGEFVNRCKDGSLVTVESAANPIFGEKDDIIGFLAIQRDISERKRVEIELATAHSFQQSIIDGIAEPIFVISPDYQILAVNHAAREFSTNNATSVEPNYCYQMSHHRNLPCEGNEHPCPLHKVEETGRPITVIHEHYQAEGARRFVEIVAAPLWNIDGSFQGIIESLRDVTEHKQAEQDLIKYTERLKAISTQLVEIEESERQRLARELHDQIGQNLTALGINLNIIQMQLPENVAPQVRFHLKDSHALVEQTTESIRSVMADLRPPVLDDYGLLAALRWYGEKISRRIQVPITVRGEEPNPRLDSKVENALFRIVQEALTNISKHAQAAKVRITLVVERDSLELTVVDDGIGFDPEIITQPEIGGGWGIISITERAEAVGGVCQILSTPHQGTRVSVKVPR